MDQASAISLAAARTSPLGGNLGLVTDARQLSDNMLPGQNPYNPAAMRKSLPYDLDLVHEQCNEVGLSSEFIEPNTLAIRLADGVNLRFVNNVTTHFLDGSAVDDDALIDLGDDSSWHTHGHEFQFSDPRGHYISMDYLDLVAGIAAGEILIAELWNKGNLKERWLLHKDYNDDFDYFEAGDEIRVRRIFPSKQPSD